MCEEDKVKVIPLGFDLRKFQNNNKTNRNIFRDEFNLLDDDIAIGIVGRLTAIKNQKLFLNSAQIVSQKLKQNIKFFVVGDGEDRDFLFNLCDELGLSYDYVDSKNNVASVHFISWRTDMERVYSGLDIVALTSLNEGTPVTLIEAQAANKPIVTTNVGGIIDIVKENETALIAKNNVDDFSQKLSLLCDDNKLRKELGSNGYNHVKDLFSYQRLVYDMKELYKSLLLFLKTRSVELNTKFHPYLMIKRILINLLNIIMTSQS